MSTCQSCGGVIGRDCFNPIECMMITQAMIADDAVQRALRRRDEESELHDYGEHCREEHERHCLEELGFDPIAMGM